MSNQGRECGWSRITRTSICAAAVVAFCSTTALGQQPASHGWLPIFDGRALAGWKGAAQYDIEDGVLALRGRSATDALCTEQAYGDFVLRFRAHASSAASRAEVLFRARRDSGRQ